MSGLLDTALVQGFILVLARTGAVMAGLPILGDRWLPARVRVVSARAAHSSACRADISVSTNTLP